MITGKDVPLILQAGCEQRSWLVKRTPLSKNSNFQSVHFFEIYTV